MINILLATPWNTPCGIADHSAQLKAAVETADPHLFVRPENTLEPATLELPADWNSQAWPVVHVNYHEAVTTAWGPDVLQRLRGQGVKIVVTYHNTFGEHTPAEMRANGDHRLDLLEQFCEVADAVVVHEPCRGLPHPEKVHYWRQGVPALPSVVLIPDAVPVAPVLGMCGFNFPVKHFDRMCEITRECGWMIRIFSANATEADQIRWQQLNPLARSVVGFQPRAQVIQGLSECDATAFLYVGAFAGTSGAVRLGIAARKPVLVFLGQRQMRDLHDAYPWAFHWCDGWEAVGVQLRHLPIQRVYPPMVYVAEQDSWTRLGKKYADLYRGLLT